MRNKPVKPAHPEMAMTFRRTGNQISRLSTRLYLLGIFATTESAPLIWILWRLLCSVPRLFRVFSGHAFSLQARPQSPPVAPRRQQSSLLKHLDSGTTGIRWKTHELPTRLDTARNRLILQAQAAHAKISPATRKKLGPIHAGCQGGRRANCHCGSAWPGIEQVGAWPTELIV